MAQPKLPALIPSLESQTRHCPAAEASVNQGRVGETPHLAVPARDQPRG